MANQKSNIHDIELKTLNLNCNKYKNEISDYDGFNRLNSCYYGDVLSPWYVKIDASVGNSFTAQDGVVYRIDRDTDSLIATEDNVSTNIMILERYRRLNKIPIFTPPAEFPEIIGVFTEDEYLCAKVSGNVQQTGGLAIYKVGQAPIVIANTNDAYKPGFKVYFCKKYYDIKSGYDEYTFAINDTIYFYKNGLIIKRNVGEFNKAISAFVNDDILLYSTFDGTTTNLYTINGTTFIQITRAYYNDKTQYRNISRFFVNSEGRFIDYGIGVNTYEGQVISEYTHFGTVESYELVEGYHSIIITPNTKTKLIHNTGEVDSQIVNINFSDSALFATIAYKTIGYINQNETRERYIPVTESNNGFTVMINRESKENYNYYETESVTISGANTTVVLLDGNQQTMSFNPPMSNNIPAFGMYADIKVKLISDYQEYWRLLYNNNELTAISITTEESFVGTLLTPYTDIDDTFPICIFNQLNVKNNVIGSYLAYKSISSGWVVINAAFSGWVPKDYKMTIIDNRYILLNIDAYYNCYDTVERKLYHFAPDYNNRTIINTLYSNETPIEYLTDYNKNTEAYNYGSGQGVNYSILGTSFISALFPQQVVYLPKNIYNRQYKCKGSYTLEPLDIDIYLSPMIEGNAIYVSSLDDNKTYINTSLVSTEYNYTSAIYIPTLFSTFISGFTNQGIIVDNGKSYLQIYNNGTKAIFGISLSDQLEGVESAFIIQGQYYVVINKVIYRYNLNGIVSPIISIDRMKFVGNTPYQAIFWSATNKSFYSFVGDNRITLMTQATEIGHINASAYNPNTLSIYILADSGVYIFTDGSLVRLELPNMKAVYPLSTGASFSGENETITISQNKLNGYQVIPIELETKYYGLGQNIVSVNDCVYLRLFSDDLKNGEVELNVKTMNEGEYKTETKKFSINQSMWDKESSTLFLRYQPRYQSATGFSVYIKSQFPIASLSIGSTPKTVQNSKYNV